MDDNSRESLNDMISEYNELEIKIDILEKKLQMYLGDVTLKNIAKIHRDKSVENYYQFKDAIYAENNLLKMSIDKLYYEKLKEATNIYIQICHNFKKYINKKWNILLKREILIQIEEYNEICTYIENYELKDNLVELFKDRYNDIDIKKIKPGDILKLYKFDLISLKEIGLMDAFMENRAEIEEIAKNKELECDEYWKEVYTFTLNFLNSVTKKER